MKIGVLVGFTVSIISTFVSFFCDNLSQRNEMSNIDVLCGSVHQLTSQDELRSSSGSPVPVVVIEVSFCFTACSDPSLLFAFVLLCK
jgi:hypothetical protein